MFIAEANRMYNKQVKGIDQGAMQKLLGYSWPGNIRELKWCIHRAVALATDGIISIKEVALQDETKVSTAASVDTTSLPYAEAMARLDRDYLENALHTAEGNKTRAAQILGISVRTLHYKLEKYGL
jgi:DNA-binding NtrC family response regulator